MLNLGLSVVIFLIIGVVVMALFCLVTRYFNKKLEKALQDQNQVYSMIEQIRGTQNEEQVDGQYENYLNNKENDTMQKLKKNQPFQLQMTQVQQPLKGFGKENNFGLGRLKRRLEGEQVPSGVPLNPQTGRSAVNSLKSFRPDKLDSLRSNNFSNRTKNGQTNPQDDKQSDNNLNSSPKKPKKEKKDNITKHQYTSKIVAYIQQGIFLIQNNLISVTKKDGKIEQKRTIKRSKIRPEQNSFDDALQAYGFEKGMYCAFKFDSVLQIPHMKPNQQYPVGSLKGTQSKQPIQFAEYYSIKDKLEEQA